MFKMIRLFRRIVVLVMVLILVATLSFCSKLTCNHEGTERIWIVDIPPTKTENGVQHSECAKCGREIESMVIYAGSIGLEFSENTDGTFSLSGDKNCKDNQIVIPSKYNGMDVTIIGTHAFLGSYYLTEVTIPRTIKIIEAYAFSQCKKLSSISIPNSVETIENYAFTKCENLSFVEILGKSTNIGVAAFKNCVNLREIILPGNLASINAYTFSKCEALSSIVIPKSVKIIGNEAFYGCKSLVEIHYEGTMSEWNKIKLGLGWNELVPATTVICADGTIRLK